MNITGKTKITGLFGYPVGHSLSPSMHNAAFEYLGLDYCYLPFLVRPDSLTAAVDAIRAFNMEGVNVTLPHKESVIPLLDSIDKEASFIGAVNTIVNIDEKLIGYNTDGRGFMRGVADNISLKGKKILIVGTGGAARAISYYISEQASLLFLFDIDSEKQERLVEDLSRIRKNVSGLNRIERLSDYEIIINATPLGLKKGDPFPLDVSGLTEQHAVIDLIYRPTALLELASQKGCRTSDGLGMLLWQGALAFELWTNHVAPVEIMQKVLLDRIK
jgi:shikimate dehydrogenase